MDLSFTPDELAFREEVRAFLSEKVPTDLTDKVCEGRHLSKADHERWAPIIKASGFRATD